MIQFNLNLAQKFCFKSNKFVGKPNQQTRTRSQWEMFSRKKPKNEAIPTIYGLEGTLFFYVNSDLKYINEKVFYVNMLNYSQQKTNITSKFVFFL